MPSRRPSRYGFATRQYTRTIEPHGAERAAETSPSATGLPFTGEAAIAPAQRAEPRIGELPRREHVVGRRQLQIGFGAEHELTSLPVVAGLRAAHDPAGLVGLLVVAPH